MDIAQIRREFISAGWVPMVLRENATELAEIAYRHEEKNCYLFPTDAISEGSKFDNQYPEIRNEPPQFALVQRDNNRFIVIQRSADPALLLVTAKLRGML